MLKIFSKKYQIRELSIIWWIWTLTKCAFFVYLFMEILWWVS